MDGSTVSVSSVEGKIRRSVNTKISWYQAYSPALYGMICHCVPDEQLAEEILVNVFTEIENTAEIMDSEDRTIFFKLLLHTRAIIKRHGDHLTTTGNEILPNNLTVNETGLSIERKILEQIYLNGLSADKAFGTSGVCLEHKKKCLRKAILELREEQAAKLQSTRA